MCVFSSRRTFYIEKQRLDSFFFFFSNSEQNAKNAYYLYTNIFQNEFYTISSVTLTPIYFFFFLVRLSDSRDEFNVTLEA